MAAVTVTRTRFLSMCRSYRSGASHRHYDAEKLKAGMPAKGGAQLMFYFHESEGWVSSWWKVDWAPGQPLAYACLLLPEDVLHKLKYPARSSEPEEVDA